MVLESLLPFHKRPREVDPLALWGAVLTHFGCLRFSMQVKTPVLLDLHMVTRPCEFDLRLNGCQPNQRRRTCTTCSTLFLVDQHNIRYPSEGPNRRRRLVLLDQYCARDRKCFTVALTPMVPSPSTHTQRWCFAHSNQSFCAARRNAVMATELLSYYYREPLFLEPNVSFLYAKTIGK